MKTQSTKNDWRNSKELEADKLFYLSMLGLALIVCATGVALAYLWGSA